jgi:hypothetical protein
MHTDDYTSTSYPRQCQTRQSTSSGRFLSELFLCNVGSCGSYTCHPLRTAHRMIRPLSLLVSLSSPLWSVAISQTLGAEQVRYILGCVVKVFNCIRALYLFGLEYIKSAVRYKTDDISNKMCFSSENFFHFSMMAS